MKQSNIIYPQYVIHWNDGPLGKNGGYFSIVNVK